MKQTIWHVEEGSTETSMFAIYRNGEHVGNVTREAAADLVATLRAGSTRPVAPQPRRKRVVELEETSIEVPVKRHLRPSTYRFTRGAYLIVDGRKQYPPLPIREARRLLRQYREEDARA